MNGTMPDEGTDPVAADTAAERGGAEGDQREARRPRVPTCGKAPGSLNQLFSNRSWPASAVCVEVGCGVDRAAVGEYVVARGSRATVGRRGAVVLGTVTTVASAGWVEAVDVVAGDDRRGRDLVGGRHVGRGHQVGAGRVEHRGDDDALLGAELRVARRQGEGGDGRDRRVGITCW